MEPARLSDAALTNGSPNGAETAILGIARQTRNNARNHDYSDINLSIYAIHIGLKQPVTSFVTPRYSPRAYQRDGKTRTRIRRT